MTELKELYERNFNSLCIYSSNIVKRTDIAKDIVQDSFIAFNDNIHKVRNKKQYENIIKKIVRNKSIDHYRKYIKRRREISVDDYNHNMESQYTNQPKFEIIGRDDNILQKLINMDNTEILKDAINKLTPRYKQIYEMYEIKKMQHKDISETLGIVESTSKSNLSRARNKLKKILLDEFL